MIKAQFLIGVPVDFKKICRIYPPTVRDVIANQDYSLFLKLLTFSQEEIEDEFNEHGYDLSNLLTPFEYIFNNAYHNQ